MPAIVAGAGLVGLFLAVKVGAEGRRRLAGRGTFGMPTRDANYTTLLMSTA